MYVGIGITVIWLGLYYYSLLYLGESKLRALIHLIIDYSIVVSVLALLSVLFKIMVWQDLIHLSIFGSKLIVLSWLSLPVAIVYDYWAIKNILNAQINSIVTTNNIQPKFQSIKEYCRGKYSSNKDYEECIEKI